jgi:hypothetical protein
VLPSAGSQPFEASYRLALEHVHTGVRYTDASPTRWGEHRFCDWVYTVTAGLHTVALEVNRCGPGIRPDALGWRCWRAVDSPTRRR